MAALARTQEARSGERARLGILVPGTAYHYPVPARELETLGMESYTFGGVGGNGAAK
jgi:hypothetical protein